MGRIVSIGITSQPTLLHGTTAERPVVANPGVIYYNTDINLLQIYNSAAWIPVGGFNTVTVTSNTNAESSTAYLVDTSGGGVIMTLPSSPTLGDKIQMIDVKGTYGTNNLTINNNGNPIMRQNDTMTVSTNGAAFTLMYSGATDGWLVENI
jgi:hypothetical protein